MDKCRKLGLVPETWLVWVLITLAAWCVLGAVAAVPIGRSLRALAAIGSRADDAFPPASITRGGW